MSAHSQSHRHSSSSSKSLKHDTTTVQYIYIWDDHKERSFDEECAIGPNGIDCVNGTEKTPPRRSVFNLHIDIVHFFWRACDKYLREMNHHQPQHLQILLRFTIDWSAFNSTEDRSDRECTLINFFANIWPCKY